MAKLNNPLNTRYRDKSDGPVGQLNFTGPSMRSYVRTKQNRNNTRSIFRYTFVELVLFWHSLSDTQRDAWTMFGTDNPEIDKYGEEIILTGYSWFIRLNQPRNFAGLNPLSIPPMSASPTYNPSRVITFSVSPFKFSVDLSPRPIGEQFVLFKTSINNPESRTKPLRYYWHGGFLNASTSYPTVIPVRGDITFGDYLGKFSFRSYDQYGRSPGVEFDDILQATSI